MGARHRDGMPLRVSRDSMQARCRDRVTTRMLLPHPVRARNSGIIPARMFEHDVGAGQGKGVPTWVLPEEPQPFKI